MGSSQFIPRVKTAKPLRLWCINETDLQLQDKRGCSVSSGFPRRPAKLSSLGHLTSLDHVPRALYFMVSYRTLNIVSDLNLHQAACFATLDMGSLLNVILIQPIQECLLSSLPLGDLFNLSKTSSAFRAAFHGFQFEQRNQELLSSTQLRPPLLIGQHNTWHWKSCKSRSLLLCSEPHHVRGDKVRGCRMCSMPVCEACIIRSSFGKRDERKYSNRTRSLCPDCYALGNVHRERLSKGTGLESGPPYLNPGEPVCTCTANDGHLCIRCKAGQKSDMEKNLDRCHGKGCSRAKEGGFAGRVCLCQ